VQDFIALMQARGIVHDTTLVAFESLFTQRQGEVDPGYAGIIDHLPPVLQRGLHENSMDVTAANVDRYRASYAKMVEMVGRLYKAGVPLVAGTDGTAGFNLHRELELYVKAGIPPAEALRVATWNGARYTNLLDQLGSVSPGKRADLLLVDGDPTQNISDIRHIALVLKDGVAYYPAEIYQAIGIEPFTPAATATALPSSGRSGGGSTSGK
jgi:imidazolonepropionase-like amidohydrolase